LLSAIYLSFYLSFKTSALLPITLFSGLKGVHHGGNFTSLFVSAWAAKHQQLCGTPG